MDSFAQHGIKAEIHNAEDGAKINELAASAARSGSFAVAAGGGDGTVNAVASALVDSECALGLLPMGTLNHFARDLGIPRGLDRAVETIASGQIRKVDVGEVNGKIFVNNSSLGLYPSMVNRRNEQQRLGRNKWAALFWATLAVLRHHRRFTVRLTSDGGRQDTHRTPIVFIGNNPYRMRGLEIDSRPSLDGGKLAVYLVHQDRPATLIRMGVEALLGRLHHGVDFDFWTVEKLQIESHRKEIPVAIDGQVLTFSLPLVYRIRPRALRVIVPAV